MNLTIVPILSIIVRYFAIKELSKSEHKQNIRRVIILTELFQNEKAFFIYDLKEVMASPIRISRKIILKFNCDSFFPIKKLTPQ